MLSKVIKPKILAIPYDAIPHGKGLGRGNGPKIKQSTWNNPKLKDKVWPKKKEI